MNIEHYHDYGIPPVLTGRWWHVHEWDGEPHDHKGYAEIEWQLFAIEQEEWRYPKLERRIRKKADG